MRLSTKSTYGLRALLNIALRADEVVSINEIAEDEGISVSYLEQLLNKLRKKGLIESVRGPRGGYTLSDSPDRITVGDIVRALEGDIQPVHCVAGDERVSSSCKRSGGCVPKIVWVKLAGAIKDCLDSISLEDLCLEAGKKTAYSIYRR